MIPYVICLVLIGLPVFLTELLVAQYSGIGATKIYGRMSRAMRGMGYGMVTIPYITNLNYVVIMAYSFFFLFHGMSKTLPWSTCTDGWNSVNCYSVSQARECQSTETFYNKTCVDGDTFCSSFCIDEVNNNYGCLEYYESEPTSCYNRTGDFFVPFQDVTFRTSSSEDYW